MSDTRITPGAASLRLTGHPPSLPPYHRQLLDFSHRLIEEGGREKCQLAVVMVQAACETLGEQILVTLLDRLKPESFRAWVRARIGRSVDVVAFYKALTSNRIDTGGGLWQEYEKHVKRRHQVVHRGARVSRQDARQSYETAQKVIEHFEALLR